MKSTTNVIALARGLGSALRLERHKKKFNDIRLMGKIPNTIYYGSDSSKIVLTAEEISKARENALKIAE